jgi:hypothetical protein
MSSLVPSSGIEQAIRMVRGQKVIFDFDLAAMYGVTTFNLNKAVRRNRERFPDDCLLVVPAQEVAHLIFQAGISKSGSGGRRKATFAFTEQGWRCCPACCAVRGQSK